MDIGAREPFFLGDRGNFPGGILVNIGFSACCLDGKKSFLLGGEVKAWCTN